MSSSACKTGWKSVDSKVVGTCCIVSNYSGTGKDLKYCKASSKICTDYSGCSPNCCSSTNCGGSDSDCRGASSIRFVSVCDDLYLVRERVCSSSGCFTYFFSLGDSPAVLAGKIVGGYIGGVFALSIVVLLLMYFFNPTFKAVITSATQSTGSAKADTTPATS